MSTVNRVLAAGRITRGAARDLRGLGLRPVGIALLVLMGLTLWLGGAFLIGLVITHSVLGAGMFSGLALVLLLWLACIMLDL